MQEEGKQERRKSPRYETDAKIQFYVNFDVHTRVDYRVKKEGEGQFSKQKHTGISKNVSVEGFCFSSDVGLKKSDGLYMEVFVPQSTKPIVMEGTVQWCRPAGDARFDTGVKVRDVNGESVANTIFFDNIHKLLWSNLLDAVFSSFKELSKARIDRLRSVSSPSAKP
ncbi:MAG: PilZ domain-containing protein [Candidatus Omnitrophica bacterium]|nr:PilZ domain-containing protein [Candidatus Omnitrophota bacterium]HPB67947.1 PilZ domain-containing protein [Candidatus Omnitrophota bacterium]